MTDNKLVEDMRTTARRYEDTMGLTREGAIRRIEVLHDALLGFADRIEALKQPAPDALREALEPVIHWYQSDEHPERPLHEIVADVVKDLQADRAALLNPPKHRFWGAGEPDCPPEIKAGNGELHTLRCKVCGQDSPRDTICRAALEGES